MKRIARGLMIPALLFIAACSGGQEAKEFEAGSKTGPVVNFSDEDTEMNAAMDAARRDIATLRERLLHPPATQTHVGLKARFSDGDAVEHMWIADPEVSGDGFSGTLANEPVDLPGPHQGDKVVISVGEVSDWYVRDGEAFIGGYTLRVIRKRLGPEDQKAFDESMGFTIE